MKERKDNLTWAWDSLPSFLSLLSWAPQEADNRTEDNEGVIPNGPVLAWVESLRFGIILTPLVRHRKPADKKQD